MSKGHVGVIGGEDEKNRRIKWPTCVRRFENTRDGAQTMRRAFDEGRIKIAYYVEKGAVQGVDIALGRIPFRRWRGSPHQLAEELAAQFPDPKPAPRPIQPAEAFTPPAVVVVPVEPPPETPIDGAPAALAPKWTSDEVEAVVIALENCEDSAEAFVAKYNFVTEGRDRTAAELALVLDRVAKARGIQVGAAFISALDDLAHGRQRKPAPKPHRPRVEPAKPAPAAEPAPIAPPTDEIGRLAQLARALGLSPVEAFDRIAPLVVKGTAK